MDIFLPIRFRTHVQLAPGVIGTADTDGLVIEKLRKNLEGVCSRFGYIRPGSIEITKRSAGSLMKEHFNGNVRYDVVCRAEVCNPVHGTVLSAVVKNKNELGVLAEGGIDVDGRRMPILDVLIPRRSAGITSEIDLEEVGIGDEVFVEVLGKRYQLLDKKISVIARCVKEPRKVRAAVAVAEEGQVEDVLGEGEDDYESIGEGEETEKSDVEKSDGDSSGSASEAEEEDYESESSGGSDDGGGDVGGDADDF
jgi:DNA-directed RNA polymerase subunit E'/Rpb7